jgi:hypothetical protein
MQAISRRNEAKGLAEISRRTEAKGLAEISRRTEAKGLADNLQASLLYELHHQTAAALKARVPCKTWLYPKSRCLTVRLENGKRLVTSNVKSATCSRTTSQPIPWGQQHQILAWTGSASFKTGPREVVGTVLRTCLWTIELLQSILKQPGKVEEFQHLGWSPHSCLVTGLRRSAVPALASAVASACVKVAALEVPGMTWCTADYDANVCQVKAYFPFK